MKFVFCSLEKDEQTVEQISAEVRGLTATSDEANTSTPTVPESSVAEPASELWGNLDRKAAEAPKHCSITVESTVEMRHYLQEKNTPRHDDPLKWWKEQGSQYPHLQQQEKYLCNPSTSVAAARLFGKLISKRISGLKPANVNMLFFLNKNLY